MPLKLKVRAIEVSTPRIRCIDLISEDGADLPAFTAGAHIDLRLGNGEERSYSLLNDPRERDRYVIAVLREEVGRGGSAWVHDSLQIGNTLESSDPINNFPLNEAGERHILIAGGIGITPILSMAERLCAIDATFNLHYCARTREEAAFVDMIEKRMSHCAAFHDDGGDPSRGLDVQALLAKRPPGGHVYVCGPASLIRAVREAARDWPKGTVHYELFHGDEASIAPRSTDTAFDIVTAKTNKRIHVPANSSILQALKAEGFRIKTLCKEGVCGTCRVGLLEGVADHRDEVLTEEEQTRFIQVCVSRAMPGETLVLDI